MRPTTQDDGGQETSSAGARDGHPRCRVGLQLNQIAKDGGDKKR
jgi:hypothetical protein